jgi:hypothetical protein
MAAMDGSPYASRTGCTVPRARTGAGRSRGAWRRRSVAFTSSAFAAGGGRCRPLIVTGQAWWGEAAGWTEGIAEKKLAAFLAGFDGYAGIVGLNWWNLAAPDAMSARMRTMIAAARLDRRFPQASAR